MDSSTNVQSGVNVDVIMNTNDHLDRSPEFPIVQTLSSENNRRTSDHSTVYHQHSSIRSRPSISMVAEENFGLQQRVQPLSSSLDSPARGKRFSPDDEDGEMSDNDFKLASNRKKKAPNSPGASTIVIQPSFQDSSTVSQTVSRAPTLAPGNPHAIINAATRYALTRYPLPPFTIRFSTPQVDVNKLKSELAAHVINVHRKEINIIGCRRSNVRCGINECDILIHIKETDSFSVLLTKTNWPSNLVGLSYVIVNMPSIPPQLSLLVRNVDLQIDQSDFEREVKTICPDVKNVLRMKNKFGKDINLIKLELISVDAQNTLLTSKKLKLNYMVYEVTEFLAPVNVLICSKCCGIGHFRKQCPEELETCRKCSHKFQDPKLHNCSNQIKCKHCDGDHYSNSNRCPVIKNFRSTLTRQMMARNEQVYPPSLMNNGSINHVGSNNVTNVHSISTWGASNNVLSQKLDDMVKGLAVLNQSLNVIIASNVKFTNFMHEKTVQDQSTREEIGKLNSQMGKVEQIQTSMSNKVLSLENDVQQQLSLVNRLILPILEELLSFVSSLNKDKLGRPTDADLRSRLGRYKSQVVNALEGKTK
jgi:hypothetical protein